MRFFRFALTVGLGSAATLAAWAAPGGEVVLPVSPGAAARVLLASTTCPTFSWSGAEGAVAYELAVLDVTEPERPIVVLAHRVEGAALAWTPPRDGCLEPDHDYAWVVRAERSGAIEEWSPPLRFLVPGAPSAEELTAALAVLERWRAAGGQGPTSADVAGSRPGGRTGSQGEAETTATTEAPVATGIAAVRGEIPDATGNAYGVLGITSSPQGAGVVARNQSAGADLILDGEAQGQADTFLTQSGLDRPSASTQTFNFGNSGAGLLNLTVDGVAVSKEGHVHAGEAITTGTVADARLAATLARDSEVVPIVLAGDGPGSGLDADKLDGNDSSVFAFAIHNHYGHVFSGSGNTYALGLLNDNVSGYGLFAQNSYGVAVEAVGGGAYLGAVTGGNGDLWGRGVYGYASSGTGSGVYGEATSATGGVGVYGLAVGLDGFGAILQNTGGGTAAIVDGYGQLRDRAALRVRNNSNLGIAAYLSVDSSVAAMHVRNGAGGEVLYLQNGGTDAVGTGGNDFIRAVNYYEDDSQFRVLTSGEVRSDVGFYTPAADFAEMLPAATGLEPGDVLAIGSDGRLVRADEAFAANVAGVFSTAPGFVGGHPVETEARDGDVPLAVVGIVPVKASAENGAIAPGDLLVAAATPGHAMRAGSAAPNGTVIGKALEPLAAGAGTIRMLVVLQ